MLTRAEQKALYDTLVGSLVINTKPDGSGDDITIPVSVIWGYEPREIVLPAIVLNFISYDNPTEKTLGDVWKETDNGQFIGYIAESTLMVKIWAIDYGNADDDNFIEKTDIAQALYERIFTNALHIWDNLIENGSVAEDGISPANDVSEILEMEGYRNLQLTIRIKKLTGSVPVETGIKFATAGTLIAVDTDVIN